jgi:transposase, IS5 family
VISKILTWVRGVGVLYTGLECSGPKPQFQRKKPRGKEDAGPYRARQCHPSRVRSRVEHVSVAQKCRLGLIVRSVGVVRARVKIGLANVAYNFTRLAWLQRRNTPA